VLRHRESGGESQQADNRFSDNPRQIFSIERKLIEECVAGISNFNPIIFVFYCATVN